LIVLSNRLDYPLDVVDVDNEAILGVHDEFEHARRILRSC